MNKLTSLTEGAEKLHMNYLEGIRQGEREIANEFRKHEAELVSETKEAFRKSIDEMNEQNHNAAMKKPLSKFLLLWSFILVAAFVAGMILQSLISAYS